MRLRILSAVVALTALLQATGCCCLRDRICARRAYWRNYGGGGSCCCEPACCDSHYSPISNPPPLARPMGYTVEPGR